MGMDFVFWFQGSPIWAFGVPSRSLFHLLSDRANQDVLFPPANFLHQYMHAHTHTLTYEIIPIVGILSAAMQENPLKEIKADAANSHFLPLFPLLHSWCLLVCMINFINFPDLLCHQNKYDSCGAASILSLARRAAEMCFLVDCRLW